MIAFEVVARAVAIGANHNRLRAISKNPEIRVPQTRQTIRRRTHSIGRNPHRSRRLIQMNPIGVTRHHVATAADRATHHCPGHITSQVHTSSGIAQPRLAVRTRSHEIARHLCPLSPADADPVQIVTGNHITGTGHTYHHVGCTTIHQNPAGAVPHAPLTVRSHPHIIALQTDAGRTGPRHPHSQPRVPAEHIPRRCRRATNQHARRLRHRNPAATVRQRSRTRSIGADQIARNHDRSGGTAEPNTVAIVTRNLIAFTSLTAANLQSRIAARHKHPMMICRLCRARRIRPDAIATNLCLNRVREINSLIETAANHVALTSQATANLRPGSRADDCNTAGTIRQAIAGGINTQPIPINQRTRCACTLQQNSRTAVPRNHIHCSGQRSANLVVCARYNANAIPGIRQRRGPRCRRPNPISLNQCLTATIHQNPMTCVATDHIPLAGLRATNLRFLATQNQSRR